MEIKYPSDWNKTKCMFIGKMVIKQNVYGVYIDRGFDNETQIYWKPHIAYM